MTVREVYVLDDEEYSQQQVREGRDGQAHFNGIRG